MGQSSARVVIVGSINMDLVTRVARLPRPGETISGRELLQIPGGKGANQAVAAARLGAHASMIGRVGRDGFGEVLLRALRAANVTVDCVQVQEDRSSGVALISVDDAGQNCITIVAGANACVSPADVARHESVVSSANTVLLQLEIPLETVIAAIQAARCCGRLSVLDPAPVPPMTLPDELFHVDVISPNQTEAEQLTGIAVGDPESAERAARVLIRRGAAAVVIKLGEQGAFWCDGRSSGHVPARQVTVVDTTAAGDAFTAALGCALAEGLSLPDAVRFGCAAGTLATTQMGAQCSMPARVDVERFLRG